MTTVAAAELGAERARGMIAAADERLTRRRCG